MLSYFERRQSRDKSFLKMKSHIRKRTGEFPNRRVASLDRTSLSHRQDDNVIRSYYRYTILNIITICIWRTSHLQTTQDTHSKSRTLQRLFAATLCLPSGTTLVSSAREKKNKIIIWQNAKTTQTNNCCRREDEGRKAEIVRNFQII